ncbi:MAG: transposase [Bosea sp.]|uniref:IS3 family transposase n=1 Tax=Bosea sp. (in: a-proteobacteria) TaxID=1871050 RepID=UPI001AC9363E|nr:IS3 family transposase [Bosea sp. (in: a-proteobacteria)]MBN9467206.1 transposase [Bosea sp. (in: a-proteobacteria)]
MVRSLIGVERSTYYDMPAASIDDTALVETMAAISDSFEAYGWRRMQAALRHCGLVANHKKIRRLMRSMAFSHVGAKQMPRAFWPSVSALRETAMPASCACLSAPRSARFRRHAPQQVS